MPYAKYRIEELSIEGFRGFTTPQSLSFHGKNVFVFGQNGRGKSSIVEAIRWCLFGSAAGADIEVRNTFYTNQECRVSLKLSGTTGTLRIERELRPGQERSRQIVRDSAGGEIRARDVLPQLTRLGAHDGTQVIFAAQHAAGRQINADISDFGRVLCYYLNLENVPDILKALASLLEEKQAEAEELSENIESVAAVFRDRRGALQGRIEEIVVNPPWGEGPSPTQNETIGRILTLLQELATVLDREVPDNSAPADALNLADQWIELLATRSVGDLEARIAHLSERLNQATSLMSTARSSREDLRAKERLRRKYRQQIRELLAERTIEQLRRRLQRLEHRQDLHASCAAVAEHVAQICETFALKDCPACGSAFENRELLAKARSRSKGDVAALRQSEEIQAIRDRLDSAEELNEALDGIAVEIQSESEFFDAALGDLQSSLHLEKLEKDFTQLEGHLEKIRYDLNTLRRTLNDSREEKAKRLSRSRGLRQELSFHSYRDQIIELDKKIDEGMRDARSLLADYHNLIAQVQKVRAFIQEGFKRALDRALPPLSKMLTEVYRRLTQQVSYERVCIYHDPERIGNLELRVASARLPEQDFPVNVLNGQASKALHLVPYLVFSRFQPALLELDLLLIDDPSESFDTSHVSLLVEELRTAAEHAQILVASHEQEKFLPELENNFMDGSRVTLVVTDFHPLNGPRIEQR